MQRAAIAAALILAAIAVFLSALLHTRVASTTERTNGALCTFRADVRQRADSTEAFLRSHPRGIPGVPIATLRQSLTGQRRTVKALASLDCPSPPATPGH